MSEEKEEIVFKKVQGTRRGRKGREEQFGGDGSKGVEDEGEVVLAARADVGRRRGLASEEKRAKTDEAVVYHNTGTVGPRAEFTVGVEVEADDAKKLVTLSDGGGGLQQVVDGEKIYTGEKNYASFLKKGEPKIKGGGLRAGPVKQSGFIRSSVTIDYNPSICKDYKQTGYCGYGANCKYIHDRGDYKSGWEIDKEWVARQRQGGEEENFEIGSSEEDGELPFACFICREDFVNPIVTKCGHYFCEECALKQEKKTRRCFICNEPTGGIFNEPRALIEKLRKKEKK